MTIRETIARLQAINLEARLTKMQELGAPAIVIDQITKYLEDANTANIKVNGLERKHKVGNAQVTEVYQQETIGNYYKAGKKQTIILKLVTEQGTFLYDYFDNKIGATATELNASINDQAFEPIKF